MAEIAALHVEAAELVADQVRVDRCLHAKQQREAGTSPKSANRRPSASSCTCFAPGPTQPSSIYSGVMPTFRLHIFRRLVSCAREVAENSRGVRVAGLLAGG